MLSKEEIEKIDLKEWLKMYRTLKDNASLIESIVTEAFIELTDCLLEEIEKLESDKQKLIEKLEEVIYKYLKRR